MLDSFCSEEISDVNQRCKLFFSCFNYRSIFANHNQTFDKKECFIINKKKIVFIGLNNHHIAEYSSGFYASHQFVCEDPGCQ